MNAMATEIIRIVPVHGGIELAAPLTTARLTYRGGPLLSAVEVFTVFWGSAWQGPQAKVMEKINEFFKYLVCSPLLDQMAEYATHSTSIRHGSVTGTVAVSKSEPDATVLDSALQAQLQAWIEDGTVSKPTANSLFFLYLPPGVTVDLRGRQSCSGFCGYHGSIAGKIFYAVMPFPDCRGCVGGLEVVDALTSVSSHELCEAITDPIPGRGWYDDANGEIGDICAWQTKKLEGWTVQLEWSNQMKSCI